MLTPLASASAKTRASAPGSSGIETKIERRRRHRPAVLGRDGPGAGDALGQHRLECGPVAATDSADHRVQRWRTSASRVSTWSALAATICP